MIMAVNAANAANATNAHLEVQSAPTREEGAAEIDPNK